MRQPDRQRLERRPNSSRRSRMSLRHNSSRRVRTLRQRRAGAAILGTVMLTREDAPKVSQEDRVRTTIQNFDTAIQKGDLATLRSITCGETADSYIKYDDARWKDIHARVAAARQYPVVASIDQVVVNNTHAEANVTSFMAFDPATRSTRSFDLEFRDEQWKICQAPQ
jgi:hypothetical protein